MKITKYLTGAALLMILAAACNSNRSSATLGGSNDTTDAVAGSNAGGADKDRSADTSTNKRSKIDSINRGNANPTGHAGSDSTRQK